MQARHHELIHFAAQVRRNSGNLFDDRFLQFCDCFRLLEDPNLMLISERTETGFPGNCFMKRRRTSFAYSWQMEKRRTMATRSSNEMLLAMTEQPNDTEKFERNEWRIRRGISDTAQNKAVVLFANFWRWIDFFSKCVISFSKLEVRLSFKKTACKLMLALPRSSRSNLLSDFLPNLYIEKIAFNMLKP